MSAQQVNSEHVWIDWNMRDKQGRYIVLVEKGSVTPGAIITCDDQEGGVRQCLVEDVTQAISGNREVAHLRLAVNRTVDDSQERISELEALLQEWLDANQFTYDWVDYEIRVKEALGRG